MLAGSVQPISNCSRRQMWVSSVVTVAVAAWLTVEVDEEVGAHCSLASTMIIFMDFDFLGF